MNLAKVAEYSKSLGVSEKGGAVRWTFHKHFDMLNNVIRLNTPTLANVLLSDDKHGNIDNRMTRFIRDDVKQYIRSSVGQADVHCSPHTPKATNIASGEQPTVGFVTPLPRCNSHPQFHSDVIEEAMQHNAQAAAIHTSFSIPVVSPADVVAQQHNTQQTGAVMSQYSYEYRYYDKNENAQEYFARCVRNTQHKTPEHAEKLALLYQTYLCHVVDRPVDEREVNKRKIQITKELVGLKALSKVQELTRRKRPRLVCRDYYDSHCQEDKQDDCNRCKVAKVELQVLHTKLVKELLELVEKKSELERELCCEQHVRREMQLFLDELQQCEQYLRWEKEQWKADSAKVDDFQSMREGQEFDMKQELLAKINHDLAVELERQLLCEKAVRLEEQYELYIKCEEEQLNEQILQFDDEPEMWCDLER